MVRRFSVSPRRVDLRLAAVLAAFFVVFSAVSTPVLGQPATREEALETRAQKTLQIAQEYVSRKVYKQAETLLSSLQGQGELAAHISDADKQIVAGLNEVVRKALTERTRIAEALMESEKLDEKGQYRQAAELLLSIRDSEYLREIEREQVIASLAVAQDKAKNQPASVAISEKAMVEPVAKPAPAGAEEKPAATEGVDVETELKATAEESKGEAVKAAEEAKAETVAQAAAQEPVVIAETRTYVVPAPRPVVPVAAEALVEKPDTEQAPVVETQPDVVPAQTETAPAQPEVVMPAPQPQVVVTETQPAVAPVATEPVEAAVEPAVAPVAAEVKADETAATEPAAVVTAAAPSEAKPQSQAEAEESYVSVVIGRQNRLRNYTKAVVDDSVAKAGELLAKNEYEAANSALDKAFSTVESNKILLGDELYRQYSTQLTILRGQIQEAHNMDILAKEEKVRIDAGNMTEDIRRKMEVQRAKAVEGYLDRAYAFNGQQRYEEALGQLEQLLAIDPTHKNALVQKATLERMIGYRTELEQEREKDKRELMLLRNSMQSQVPYDEEINYPKNWMELTARRKEEGFTSREPADAAVYRQLEQIVNLSALTEDTTFAEAMDVIRNAVDPPLPLVIMWNDISNNAFIEKTNVIGIPGEGLSSVTLLTGLKRVLEAVGGSGNLAQIAHVVDKGLVTVATKDYLPTEFKPIVYDVAELLSTPAGLSGMMGGMGGGMGGGMMGGMGGGMGGGMMGGMGGGMGMMGGMGGGGMGGMGGGGMGGMGGGMGGGGMGGGGMGGMGGGMMGGMGGGMGGGGMGGMGGGMGGGGGGMNYMMSMMRGYEVAQIIKRTVQPDTWWEEGGEGEIHPFGADKLIVSQTPEVHEEIATLLAQMVKGLGRQVAIEARFLVVDENWLQDIGLDFTLNNLSLGSHWSPLNFEVGSVEATSPISTAITNTLTSRNTVNPAMNVGMTYGSVLDDLQVSFMIKATEMHANSSMLTAPKLMVLSGDSATISINKDTYFKSDSSLTTDTVTGGQGLSYGVSYWEHETDSLQTGINMSITPVITSDKKYVLLNIQAFLTDLLGFATETTTAFTFQGTQVSDTYQLPITEQTMVQTRVNIPDQGTVMLGGLTLAGENDIESGVPVLAKVPLFGRLFSSRSEVKDKQILLILVKPTIVLKEEREADAVAQMEE